LSPRRRCRADYVSAKTDCGRALAGQQVRAHGIFEVDPAKQELIRPGVVVRVGLTRDLVVVSLREKSRGPEDDARQLLVPVEQLAKVLCRGLGDAIDVLGDGPDLLGPLCGRGSGRRDEGIAEDTGRAGENEGANAVATASSRRLSVPVMLVSMKSCRLWVAR
jgi:hypothetical protein